MQLSDPAGAVIEHWREGVQSRMLISASNGATALCMFEQWIAPGAGAPLHQHSVEEVLTVREGEAEMWLGEERIFIRIGQSLIVPAGRTHGFRNSGRGSLHILAVLAAPFFEATMAGTNQVIRRWQS